MKNKILLLLAIFMLIIPVVKADEDYSTVTKEDIETTSYEAPIIGKFEAKDVSLPVLSIVLGLVDGFNPCAMWILVFLISMLFTMKDKKKMWILGGTFILTSGLVYLLFMVSYLNLAQLLTKITIIRLGISIFAIIFGMTNIYRYFNSLGKSNGCDVTKEKDRKNIMTKIRKIVNEKKFIIAILGIILLAISVNVLELLCSLGIPLIFTEVLALNNLSILEYIIYIGIYLIFFLIDDILVFVIAMKTLSIKGISNKYTKYSHLIGGIIMLIIGILMAIKPELLMFNF